MGQKIHPTGFRLAVNRNWGSKWFANSKHFAPTLAEDIKVREYLKKKLAHASVGKVTIERPAKNARITIYSARPGVVIGKKGEDIETLRGDLRKMMGGDVGLNIEEIRKPEIDAQLIADSIAQQLEKRIMFRRAMKRAMQNAMRLGAQGIKIMSAGPPERHRDRAHASGIAKAACRCTRCAPTSTTASPRRARPTASSASRSGCSRAKCWRTTPSPPRRRRRRPKRRSARADRASTRSEECCSQLEGNTARSRRAATRASRPSATRSASASTA